ncbi:AAA family ATPase [Floricoccus penangensis]|uniref:AAA family ATPase n=1 Tax=Floricoccus penangensis TaxID=1859475 RepID=UPI00203FF2F3|nr:AAA family ATPase [Floricoccus penangensis]URZ88296.1 AAA family ATPase [Floricoccus penangensis]
MIIWLNGAFGAGKTTIAEILNKKIPNSYLYDPEEIGDFFRHNLPKSIQKDDFQKYEEWRAWNFHILKKLNDEYEGHVIVPMTLYKKASFEQIIGRLRKENIDIRHFILEVDRDQILKRLSSRSEGLQEWGANRLDDINRCFEKMTHEERIKNDGRKPIETADEIIERLNLD